MTPTDQQEPGGSGPSPALLSALTTEHYTLQAQRSSTIVEANGRSQLFLSAVSGATVALALVAQLDGLGQTFTVFALTVLPALLALGMTSYARLADLAVHDAYFARAIGRIRSFYLAIDPAAHGYWLQPAGDGPHAVMAQTGDRHSRWHHLSHTATSVAAVNGVLAGVLVALGTHLALPGAGVPALAGVASTVAVALFAALFADQERRWRRSGAGVATRFLPDGTPAMSVTGFAPAGPVRPGAVTDSARTVQGKTSAAR
jgi:hypothetical protein